MKHYHGLLKMILHCACAAGLAASAGGCITTQKRAETDARMQADVLLLREDVVRARGRVEGVEMESKRIAAELDQLREALTAADRQAGVSARKIEELERRLADLDAARAKDREAIIEQLSARMAELIAKSGASARRAGASGTGYEHTVRAGETLSQIAAAYKVSPQAVIDANDLKNPDLLKQGQKLFIPR